MILCSRLPVGRTLLVSKSIQLHGAHRSASAAIAGRWSTRRQKDLARSAEFWILFPGDTPSGLPVQAFRTLTLAQVMAFAFLDEDVRPLLAEVFHRVTETPQHVAICVVHHANAVVFIFVPTLPAIEKRRKRIGPDTLLHPEIPHAVEFHPELSH